MHEHTWRHGVDGPCGKSAISAANAGVNTSVTCAISQLLMARFVSQSVSGRSAAR